MSKKIRTNNPFFVVPLLLICINCIPIAISNYIQNNTGWDGRYNIFNIEGLVAWETAVRITEYSLLIIIICLVVRIVLLCIKKLTFFEFLVGFVLNLTAFIFCMAVVLDRI
ncbi:MAG: hypothetical protein FWG87_13520 [Defluviitaleaceae bacterium]|nr:hypothetical protein [Defluviitaleaceae bacterium]